MTLNSFTLKLSKVNINFNSSSHPSSSKTDCMLNFIPADLSLIALSLICRWHDIKPKKIRVCLPVCITTYELVTCVTMKINLSVRIWYNTQSTFPRNFRHSLFSGFDHLTWFGIVKSPSHVLCPFGDLPVDGAESWKTSKKKELFYFPYVKFYVSIWCATPQYNKQKVSLALHGLVIRTFYHN